MSDDNLTIGSCTSADNSANQEKFDFSAKLHEMSKVKKVIGVIRSWLIFPAQPIPYFFTFCFFYFRQSVVQVCSVRCLISFSVYSASSVVVKSSDAVSSYQ